MNLIVAAGITGLFLLASEAIWRKHDMPSELARKFIHVSVGSFVAFWPFFLSWNEIRLLGVGFIVVVILSKYLNIFTAIHSVQRPTMGELWFAVAVGLVTLITDDRYIYAAAILQMSLADGLAAIIGSQYGRKNRYSILNQTKSLIGTLAFLATSLVILTWFVVASGNYADSLGIAGIAVAAMLLENIGVFGLDNLLIPVFVAVALRLIT